MSFKRRILLIIGLVTMICAIAMVIISVNTTKKEKVAGIVEKSQAILSRLESVRGYIATQGGLDSTIERIVKKSPDGNITKEDKLTVLKQVPIFASMKIGAENAEVEHYKFRVFSDQPRNIDNQATPEEAAVLAKFEKDPSLKEVIDEKASVVTVYRPVRLSKTDGCLNCHGDPSTSPYKNGKDVLGYPMENWTDGKLHGAFAIISDLNLDSVKEASQRTFFNVLMWSLGLAAVALGIGIVLTARPIKSLEQVMVQLKERADSNLAKTQEIESSSKDISNSSIEQASALQETVSAVEEISSMVSKNADNAQASQDQSAKTSQSAEKGQEVVQEMIDSMKDIQSSNNDMIGKIEVSNQKITNIVQVIKEITTKTQVIHDIVFQTKLLSFNASVEAARAGEHGKGFAVVAEEVGNLAQMSGNAAKEIADLLDSSQKQVQSIVDETQKLLVEMSSQSREKIEHGTDMAQKCHESFGEIAEQVELVNKMVNEIAIASEEQARGVSEINKAMQQLDTHTQKNTQGAKSVHESVIALKSQTDELYDNIHDLESTVKGGMKNAA